MSALAELETLHAEERYREIASASINSRPFVSAAEGVYKSFIDLSPLRVIISLLEREPKLDQDCCFQTARTLLTRSFREKLKKSRNHTLFIQFIRRYFDVAIKRWK
jgi:hypothetical protein